MKTPFLLGVAACIPVIAEAQSLLASDPHAQVFTPADFEQFAPRTARDMVDQIPGFSITRSDGARGFGQAQENVLLNGERISAKSTSAREVLSRIPASNVQSIELLDGADLDIPGLNGQVVNVIVKSTGISGTWTYRQRYRENLPPVYDWIELAINGSVGDLTWYGSFESSPERGANQGRENITDGDGTLTEFRTESYTYVADYVEIDGGISWKPDSGNIANLNLKYALYEPDEREASRQFSPDGTEIRQTISLYSENEWNSEISGDYEFGIGPGRFKAIGLQRNEHSPTTSRFYGGNLDGTDLTNSVFNRTVDESESILRGEYAWQTNGQSDWQVSLEGAFNSLESEAELLEGPLLGELQPVDIGDPDIRVEEKRGETFLTYGRPLTPTLRLQTSLGTEVSEITSDGENGRTDSFVRPKGSIAATWQATNSLTVNAKIEREVGQLDFFDFVSNIDLDDGDDQNGNVEIVPEQSWRGELQFDKDYGEWGALQLTLAAEAIEDIVDQVPIGEGEGPGNLDSASRFSVDLEGTVKFDKFGWKGAQLQYEADYQYSEVDDPLTGETRRINGDKIHYIELEFRHDIPGTDWAWGINYENYYEAPVFRSDTRQSYRGTPGFAWGFIEHKDIMGMTGTIFLANLTDQDDEFTRLVYEPDRNGDLNRIEERSRNFGNILTLRLKGSF